MTTEMSRAGARAQDPGPPTSSSPAAARGARAPGGDAGAPALDASEAEVSALLGTPRCDDRPAMAGAFGSDPHPSEVALAEESGTARPAGYVPGEVPAPPRTYRPAFVDNDARPVPTTRETVPVKEGVL